MEKSIDASSFWGSYNIKPRSQEVKKEVDDQPKFSFIDVKGIRKEKKITKIRKRKKEVSDVDTNISHIHNNVINAIKHPILRENPSYYEPFADRIKNLVWMTKYSKSISERNNSLNKLNSIRAIVRDMEDGLTLGWYLLKVHKYLLKIKDSFNESFFISGENSVVKTSNDEESYIPFLSIASEFVSVPNINTKQTCDCGGAFQKEENGMVCMLCGNFIETFVRKSSYCDSSKMNSSVKNNNTRNIHFNDTVKNFQGKQNTEIVPKVYEVIRIEMQYNSITPNKLKKSHIYQFLSNNGLTHYEDINLIHSVITGIPCPDLSLYEKDLIEYHELLETAYAAIKAKYTHRISSLNVYFKLYKLLQLLGYPCNKKDFFLLKTDSKRTEHMTIWEKICEYNGWTYFEN